MFRVSKTSGCPLTDPSAQASSPGSSTTTAASDDGTSVARPSRTTATAVTGPRSASIRSSVSGIPSAPSASTGVNLSRSRSSMRL